MRYKIVADSSSNLRGLEGVAYASVPLKIVTAEKEYVDDAGLDTALMMKELAAYKGRSGTACPSVGEWLEAFGQAENVFAVTITSSLSGCYNSCVQAKAEYEQTPGRRVCCLDTLSTGPEMVLIIEKLRELISSGLYFDQIQGCVREYMKHTHLVFMLESVDNLAKNGRVSPLIARAVGVLGIRIVGKASDEGILQQLHECRGEKRGLDAMLREMEAHGYQGGRVSISHGCNEPAALALGERIKARYPQAEISILPFAGLCSFYGEKGAVMAGFEDAGV